MKKDLMKQSSAPTELLPHFFIGGVRSARDLSVLRDLKIRCVVNAARELNTDPVDSSVQYLKVIIDELDAVCGKTQWEKIGRTFHNH